MEEASKLVVSVLGLSMAALVITHALSVSRELSYIENGYQKGMVPGCMRAEWMAPSELTRLNKNAIARNNTIGE